MTAQQTDMTPADIKLALSNAGYSYADVDKLFGLAPCTSTNAAKRPDHKGEIAIAGALSKPPQSIWPSRYADDGSRLRPQPQKNYTPKPAIAKHQKACAV